MLVRVHLHVERRFHRRHRADDLHIHAIAAAAGDRKAVMLQILHHRVVVILGGTEPRSELLRRKEMAIVGAGRIVDIRYERIQARLVAHGQHDIQAHRRLGRQAPHLLCGVTAYRAAHMMRVKLCSIRRSTHAECQGDGSRQTARLACQCF